MNEEVKLTWKGRNENYLQLFVGKVSNISTDSAALTVQIDGRELYENKELSFALTEGSETCGMGLHSCKDLKYIQLGDILVVRGRSVRSIFRVESEYNSIFATQRCNSNCLMCSQPPIDLDDTYENYLAWEYAIDLIEIDLKFINITGGEPTILGEKLVILINKLLDKFPNIIIDLLSNGRLPAKDSFIIILKEIREPNRVIFAIPLYSDIYKQHDYIVQAKDAFYQTSLGIHKLANLGFLIEIRVVLHELTTERLFPLATFVHKNFPFIYHITFMGLEIIGYTKANKDKLIIKDNDQSLINLEKAINYLDKWDYNASIYNTPLCHLPESLWSYARQSISDWKNSYHVDCNKCSQKNNCAGFFSWNLKYAEVKPIL